MTYSLITGASKGIGRAFAHECAHRGRNLVLVALPNEDLRHLASQLSMKYGIRAVYRELDLNELGAIDELYHWCENNQYDIDMIINNAGFGIQQAFSNSTHINYQQLMRLNMEAMVLICSRFLPKLRKHPKAYILNMGSIASFMHIPYKAVYAASKNFVMAFSNALRHELRNDNISVTCLCPGPTITNEKVAARVNEQGFKAKLVTFQAEKVAQIGIKGLLQGKRLIIPGIMNRVAVGLAVILPRAWSLRLCSAIFSNSQADDQTGRHVAAKSKVL